MLRLLEHSARGGSFRFVHGDVMHERLELRERLQLSAHLAKLSMAGPVVFEQHIPFLRLPAVAGYGPLRPTFIQVVREPVARWVSQHYFLKACFCDTRNGTRAPRPGSFWCARDSNVYRQYDQPAMCAGDINVYYALRDPNRTYMRPDANLMVRYFCGHDAECWSAEPTAREAASLLAWDNLRTRYAWVGVLEQFNESLRLLHTALPSVMPSRVLDKHLEHPVVRNRRDISEASPNERTMRIMHTDLELDLRLYRRALGLHQDRVRSCL